MLAVVLTIAVLPNMCILFFFSFIYILQIIVYGPQAESTRRVSEKTKSLTKQTQIFIWGWLYSGVGHIILWTGQDTLRGRRSAHKHVPAQAFFIYFAASGVFFFFPILITEPVTTILGGPDIFINAGSTIKLTCVVRDLPGPPNSLLWTHNNKVT